MHRKWPFLDEVDRGRRLSDIEFLLAAFSMNYTFVEVGGFTEECNAAIEVVGPTIIWVRENQHKNAVLVEIGNHPIFTEFKESFLEEDIEVVIG